MKLGLHQVLIAVIVVLASSLSFAKNDHLKFVATYLQPGTTHPDQNYLHEVFEGLTTVHLGPEYFGSVRDSLQPQQVIFDLADELFNFEDGSLLPNYEQTIELLGTKYIDGYEKTILAFYIADEPNGWGITRTSLNLVIKALNKRFPGIPTYIVWNYLCFDSSAELDKRCGLPGERGIPDGLTWVGFDWYLRRDPSFDDVDFKTQVVDSVERLKRVTDKPIVLVPDGTDEFLQQFSPADRDVIMAKRMQMHFDFAANDSRIIGLDNYAWANHRETLRGVDTYVMGTREYPLTKKVLFDLTAKALR
ncbi:hypothetical protein [Bdellovibrio sp. NC01]|uniref:hypothetical protein n=1 Tax=Bdellovibrio sp. NC01 TaxID=2220073 RepID=UPI00115B1BBB|nr:hypothetical protein [Bdellovibrio sp. NC01]QDK37238.1 hypothetical protein DOE51_06350 [Bdellovibrio sp. NC01]